MRIANRRRSFATSQLSAIENGQLSAAITAIKEKGVLSGKRNFREPPRSSRLTFFLPALRHLMPDKGHFQI
jgi:hypothetical protein